MAVFEGYSQLLLEGTHIIKERGVGNGRFKRLFGIEHHIASKTSTWISCCPLRRGPCFFFLLWGSRASWKMVTSVRRGKNSCIILWKKRTPYKLWEKLPTLVLVKKNWSINKCWIPDLCDWEDGLEVDDHVPPDLSGSTCRELFSGRRLRAGKAFQGVLFHHGILVYIWNRDKWVSQ